MESSFIFWKVGLLVLALMGTSSATLSPTGILSLGFKILGNELK
jgi:hypothetical protein